MSGVTTAGVTTAGDTTAGVTTAGVTTMGTLLGGRVGYEQPVRGYRTGIEPVFLAAAIPAHPGQRVLEGGTGAGAALLCLAVRVPGIVAVGVERDAGMAALAGRNVARHPGLSILTGALEELGSLSAFDHVCANPPWHDPAGTAPPDPRRRAALHAAGDDTLARWSRALCRQLRPGGTVTLILAAHLVDQVRTSLHAAGAGRMAVRPLAPRLGGAAKIVLVQAVAGDTGAGRVLPPLVLHPPAGQPGYTDEAEAILRGGAALSWTA